MRILRFTGKKVYGFLSIDLNFNDDLSIVIGSNGSGKTTSVQLLQAILLPNFKDLFTIPFEQLHLYFNNNNIDYQISAFSQDNYIVIRANHIDEVLRLNTLPYSEISYLSLSVKEIEDINSTVLREYAEHPVIAFIRNTPSPVFIGLDRRNEEFENEKEDLALERRRYLNRVANDNLTRKSQFKGTLGKSLLETEFLIQDMYRRIRSIEDRLTLELQNEMLLTSFEYITFDDNFEFNTYREQRHLLSRRKEIEQVLSKIRHGDNSIFLKKLNTFFTKLASLLETVEDKEYGVSIEWLANYAQIGKLSKLVEIIDDYNSKIERRFNPINKFLEIINSYFKDSGKSIYVDKVGHLLIKRPLGKDAPIDALSSGERQIVILFANVMFNKYANSNSENILIIDEPELSLHIRWQERFVDTLLMASDKTQFILATHSPDIVGEYKNNCIKINSLNDVR
jgi:predicted ATP-binding protein involved in virulence